MVSSTILIQALIIMSIAEFSLNVVFDKIVEVGHGHGSNSVCAIDSPFNRVLPSQVVSCFLEISAEVLLIEWTHFLN
jgi:hypothetical protein